MFETIEIRTQRGGHHNSFLQHTLVSLILSKLWKICASQPPTYLFSSYMTRWQIYSRTLDTSKSVGHTSVYKMCRGHFHHGITHKSHNLDVAIDQGARSTQATRALNVKSSALSDFLQVGSTPEIQAFRRPKRILQSSAQRLKRQIMQENCKLKNHIPEKYESVWVNEKPRSIVKICLDHNESGREPARSTHTHIESVHFVTLLLAENLYWTGV